MNKSYIIVSCIYEMILQLNSCVPLSLDFFVISEDIFLVWSNTGTCHISTILPLTKSVHVIYMSYLYYLTPYKKCTCNLHVIFVLSYPLQKVYM